MSLTVVVGGQFGSEGKGKMVAHLAESCSGPVSVVRCGGTNAGHTVQYGHTRYALRQLPSGALSESCSLFLAAGMVIDPDILLEEMRDLNIDPDRVKVDCNACVLTPEDRFVEERSDLSERIGSTLSGTGSATARRIMRGTSVVTADNHPALKDFSVNVSKELNERLDRGDTVIVEGTQGAGLSLFHTPFFPYATSRDTTASAFLSEAGLAPSLVNDTIMVIRTYPIRVAGESGPMANELDWSLVKKRSGSPDDLVEYTTVTGKVRRVGEFDWGQVEDAVRLNRPSALAVHGLDYLSWADRGARDLASLSPASSQFVSHLENRFGVPVRYLFTGPSTDEMIVRGSKRSGDAITRGFANG